METYGFINIRDIVYCKKYVAFVRANTGKTSFVTEDTSYVSDVGQ
jgi:hypothetical protein